jgi:hypothetical protein
MPLNNPEQHELPNIEPITCQIVDALTGEVLAESPGSSCVLPPSAMGRYVKLVVTYRDKEREFTE